MALDQQTIQGLNQYAGNESVQVGGNIPLVPTVSENALNKLLEVTDNYAKEKRAEKDEWEKSVAERISTISKTDGVLSKDIAEISKDKKELINYIRENSYLLAPSNQVKQPEKYAELEGKVQDYLSKVEKSKADNVIWKEYQKVSAKPEYANPVMKKRADNFTSKPIMEREAFTLSATPKPLKESDLESIFMSTATGINPVSNVFGANNSLVSSYNEYTIDRGDFVKKTKSLYPEQAQFFKEYYEETIPEEEKTKLAKQGIDNADNYADFQLGNLVPETGIVRGTVKTMTNPERTFEQKKELQQVAEAGKDKRAQWTNATRVDIAEKNNAYKYWKDENGGGKSPYPALSSVITQINELEAKGTPNQFFKGYTEIGANEVSPNIISAVYPGGKGGYKGAFGTLFRSEKNGVVTYTLGVEKWYEKRKGEADYTRPETNERNYTAVPDDYVSRIEPSTNANDTYTEAQLLEKVATVEGSSRNQYYEAVSKNPDLFSFYGAGGQQTQSTGAVPFTNQQLLNSVEKMKDVKYKMGAKGENNEYDCSGLVCKVLNDNGVKVSGTSEQLITKAPTIVSSFDDIQVGDVIGIDTGERKHDKGRKLGIDHIGIVVEKDGKLYFAESTSTKGGFNMTPLQQKRDDWKNRGIETWVGRYDSAPLPSERNLTGGTKPQSSTATKSTGKKKSANDLLAEVGM
jgi:cell wall-associated NlpC family hydrolase